MTPKIEKKKNSQSLSVYFTEHPLLICILQNKENKDDHKFLCHFLKYLNHVMNDTVKAP